jgi:hypothetical protein
MMMKSRPAPKRYLVKRTSSGKVRFSLYNMLQFSLVESLSEAANQPKPESINLLEDMLTSQGRSFAQEVLARFNLNFYPQAEDKRFVMLESEALSLLMVLTTDPKLVYRHHLQSLFSELHQLLT